MDDEDDDEDFEIDFAPAPDPNRVHVNYMETVRQEADEVDGLACFDWCENWGASACWTHAGLCGGCEFC